MAARTLVQALEGVHFPCDRAQLLDYARRNNLGEGTLEVLETIPDRSYQDLGEIFTALPDSPAPQPQQRKQPAEQSPQAQPAEQRKSEAQQGGEEGEPSGEQDSFAGMAFPPLPAPMEWWLNGWRQMMMPWDAMAQCLKGTSETWPQWLRMTRHLWFPWSKE